MHFFFHYFTQKYPIISDSFILISAESGFSDERGDDTDEEEDAIEGRIRHGPRRRTRKVREYHPFNQLYKFSYKRSFNNILFLLT